jgi:hypothetical protein
MKIATDDVAAAFRGVSAEQVAVLRRGLSAMLENLGEHVSKDGFHDDR